MVLWDSGREGTKKADGSVQLGREMDSRGEPGARETTDGLTGMALGDKMDEEIWGGD